MGVVVKNQQRVLIAGKQLLAVCEFQFSYQLRLVFDTDDEWVRYTALKKIALFPLWDSLCDFEKKNKVYYFIV